MMSEGKTAERPRLAGMKFLVEEILGTDNDAKVMRISDQRNLGKAYALKVVNRNDPQDDAKLARCRAAAEASEKLGYPAILKYHEYRDRKSWFRVVRGELLMEYVAGKTLDQLKKEKVLDPWKKWSGDFINSDAFIETIYNDSTGKAGTYLKHN